MSSTAPPVPSGEGTTVDPDLIGAGPISKLRAGEEQTKGPLTSHVGQSNRPDRYIYDHFIQLATFTWSTTQLPGTLLFSVPIHPSRMNWVIAYLTALYNCWSGGFQFAVKVAGTGFHAGSVVFCRIPPNLDPTTITNPQDFTVFEWSFMDPKELDLKGFQVMDQKPFEYHYNPLNLDNPNSFGGHFAVYVQMPLATSSTGNQQVSMMVLNKCDENFNVAQVIPVQNNIIGIDYRDYENILPNFPTYVVPCDWRAAAYLRADPTILVTAPRMTEVQARLDGSDFGVKYAPLRTPMLQQGVAFGVPGIVSPWSDDAFDFKYVAPGELPNCAVLAKFRSATYVNPMGCTGTSSSLVNFPTGFAASDQLFNSNVPRLVFAPLFEGFYPADLAPLPFVPNGDETIVLFQHFEPVGPLIAVSSQTETMYRLLQALASKYSWTNNNALLFTLVHRVTELPVAYLKLYFEGVFSTSRRSTVTTWRLADYKLNFISVMSRNGIIPSSAVFEQNSLLVGAGRALDDANKRIDKLTDALGQQAIAAFSHRHPSFGDEDVVDADVSELPVEGSSLGNCGKQHFH